MMPSGQRKALIDGIQSGLFFALKKNYINWFRVKENKKFSSFSHCLSGNPALKQGNKKCQLKELLQKEKYR